MGLVRLRFLLTETLLSGEISPRSHLLLLLMRLETIYIRHSKGKCKK